MAHCCGIKFESSSFKFQFHQQHNKSHLTEHADGDNRLMFAGADLTPMSELKINNRCMIRIQFKKQLLEPFFKRSADRREGFSSRLRSLCAFCVGFLVNRFIRKDSRCTPFFCTPFFRQIKKGKFILLIVVVVVHVIVFIFKMLLCFLFHQLGSSA